MRRVFGGQSRLRTLSIFAALLMVVLAGLSVQAAESGTTLPTGRYAVADVVEKVGPAVVYIEVQYEAPERVRTYRWQSPWGGFPFDDFFFPFPFERPEPQGPQEEAPSSIGSGVIFREDGYILTNQHVVSEARGDIRKIEVTLLGRGEPIEAEVVGADRQLDLAVLRLQAEGPFPVAELGNSDEVRVGEWLVAIGNPYQYDHTVTVGVLSARGREIQIPQRTPEGRIEVRRYTNLMQTDAAINPGNSGGPLVNLDGEVVGINTAVNAEAQGIGFAIPINVATEIVDELIERGKVIRPFIGIEYRDVAPEEADYFGLPDTHGVMIANVLDNTAAEEGGLQPGDVIREVNGEPINDSDEFLEAIDDMEVGDHLSFLVMRRGRLHVIDVTVGERPADL